MGRWCPPEGDRASVHLDVGLDADLSLQQPVTPGDRVTLGIRPEHLLIGGDPGLPQLNGEAVFVELLGSDTLLHVKAGETNIVARADGMAVVRSGSTVTLSLPPGQCHLFDAAGTCISASHDVPTEPG